MAFDLCRLFMLSLEKMGKAVVLARSQDEATTQILLHVSSVTHIIQPRSFSATTNSFETLLTTKYRPIIKR